MLATQVLLLLWATMWPWLNTRSLWGKVMRAYSHTTDKLDVVRGRSVPSPSKRKGGKSAKYSAHRVLGSLNPSKDGSVPGLDVKRLPAAVVTALAGVAAPFEKRCPGNCSGCELLCGLTPMR